MVLKVVFLVKGTLNVEGFPRLENVLHVEDLKANLLMANFDGNKCQVFNNKGECIFEGTRSTNHYPKLI